MEWFGALMGVVGTVIDGAGVLAVVAGAALATARFARGVRGDAQSPYALYRRGLGRSILLGLEFLVVGDIIRTVVVAPTLENVQVLGIIVLIRTFLSISLQVELEGRWPWQSEAARE